MRRFTSVLISLLLTVSAAFAGLFLPQVTNAYVDYFSPYANTEIVYEGELCGDVDQNALRGGTFYQCANGLSCDIFEEHSGHVVEPYGRCVRDNTFLCEMTGGIVYDDMTCNCPLSTRGGCDTDVINVSHVAEYEASTDELVVDITARNTSGNTVTWSEYTSGCNSTHMNVFGVRVQWIDPPYTHSPVPDPQEYYVIGSPWEFYEFTQSTSYTPDSDGATCAAVVKNTFTFTPYETKTATVRLPGYVLDNAGYIVETKYGGSFEFQSGEEHAYLLKCSFGLVMQNGRCVNPSSVIPVVTPRAPQPVIQSELYDIRNHWAEGYINELIDRGVVEGYRNRMFYPNRPVSRAEFTKMLILALNFDLSDRSYSYFRDVNPNSWYASYVYAAAKQGVAEGYVSGYFKPGNSITRAEAVAMALRAADLDTYGYSHSFFYDVTQAWQKPYIETAYRLNLINGKGNGRFDPEGRLTRAEAAKIVANIVNLDTTNVPELRPFTTETQTTWPR